MENQVVPHFTPPDIAPDFPTIREIPIPTLSLDRFGPVLGDRRTRAVWDRVTRGRTMLAGRVVWHVNSTGAGGGVAEMLQTLLGYARGSGMDTRWLVIEGDQPFFAITKRIHNGIHASPGDGGPLGPEEQTHYTLITRKNAEALLQRIQPGDVVVLHDPQTAGIVRMLKEAGASVIWRCHIGYEGADPIVDRTWAFLRPHLQGTADAYVFTRAAFVPPWLEPQKVVFIPPSIDVFSTKNQPMSSKTVRAVLSHIGLLARSAGNGTAPLFTRNDGSQGRVERRASVVHSGQLPLPRTPLVVQVSRWDRLKDMLGVMQGFARSVAPDTDAYLALVGPDVRAVTDDPEGSAVFAECVDVWQALPRSVRDQILLVLLPMDDIEENAAMVNAIQRHASVIVQKSLFEGFGLTVTEAMWKGRAILASAVGGIKDQLVDGRHGLVLVNPADLRSFGDTLNRLLGDRDLARRLGRNAQRRALAHFLGPRHLGQYVDLFGRVLGNGAARTD
jgi:trehalose synthase